MDALRNKRGSVIVFVTLFLFTLILFIGFAFDTGQMTYLRIQAQRTTDSAALAGVAGIPKYNINGANDQIMARVTALNDSNTFKGQDASIATGNVEPVVYNRNTNTVETAGQYWEKNAVRVTKTYTTPLMLSGIFKGGAETPITVTSTAVIQQRANIPIVLYCAPTAAPGTCPTSGTYKFSGPENTPPKIAYTNWFNGSAQNPTDLINLINNPSLNPWVTRGVQINLENSQVVGPMHEIYNKWMANGQSWCVYLPVVSATIGPGVNQQNVLGFVPVTITRVVDPGNGGNQGNGPPPIEEFEFVYNTGVGCTPSYVSTVATLVR